MVGSISGWYGNQPAVLMWPEGYQGAMSHSPTYGLLSCHKKGGDGGMAHFQDVCKDWNWTHL